ncbi:MAG TPA: Asp-tRNA(Asn)/Glu-tRNA(Gln) amidotransferase subunit GatB [Anaeromyxobacter sp.]
MPVSDFQEVIGLEVHAHLLTRSKIFCGCSTEFGGEPNAHTCPVCLGFPGVLPALNARVVEFAVRAGLALGCTIRRKSVFARKNYFYPDLPKGYQISQYELPVCEGGGVDVTIGGAEKRIRLVRIHIEEDAGKNVHDVSADGSSGVDLNRAGVPLLEIVSEPDLRSADEAIEYLKELRAVLMYLGVNDGNLQEGSFRCDANVSVMRKGAQQYGTRCEIKNMNSFRFLRAAIEYEVRRQVEIVEGGGKVEQETRLFDPERGETRSMRSKEEAHDYRYFPEPDLPPLLVEDALVERVRKELPELPRARARRYQESLGLSAYDAGVLVAERPVAEFFDAALAAYGKGPEAAKKVANWMNGEVARLAHERGEGPGAWKLTPAKLAAVLRLLDAGTLGGPGAKQVVEEVFARGGEPEEIVRAKGLAQVSDEAAVEAAVERIVAASPSEVERYRAGNKKLLGFFVGQVMKEMKGKGNPAVVNAIVKKKLGK